MIRESVVDTALNRLSQGKTLADIQHELHLEPEELELITIAEQLKSHVSDITPSDQLSAELLKKIEPDSVTMQEPTRYNLYERIKQRLTRFSL